MITLVFTPWQRRKKEWLRTLYTGINSDKRYFKRTFRNTCTHHCTQKNGVMIITASEDPRYITQKIDWEINL